MSEGPALGRARSSVGPGGHFARQTSAEQKAAAESFANDVLGGFDATVGRRQSSAGGERAGLSRQNSAAGKTGAGLVRQISRELTALQDGSWADADTFAAPITARHFDVLDRLVSMGELQPSGHPSLAQRSLVYLESDDSDSDTRA